MGLCWPTPGGNKKSSEDELATPLTNPMEMSTIYRPLYIGTRFVPPNNRISRSPQRQRDGTLVDAVLASPYYDVAVALGLSTELNLELCCECSKCQTVYLTETQCGALNHLNTNRDSIFVTVSTVSRDSEKYFKMSDNSIAPGYVYMATDFPGMINLESQTVLATDIARIVQESTVILPLRREDVDGLRKTHHCTPFTIIN